MHERPQAPGAMHASRTGTSCRTQKSSTARNACLRLHASTCPSSKLGRRLSVPLHLAHSNCGSRNFEMQDPTCEPTSHASAISRGRRYKASTFPTSQMKAQVADETAICSKQQRLQRTATARNPGGVVVVHLKMALLHRSCRKNLSSTGAAETTSPPQDLQTESLPNRSCRSKISSTGAAEAISLPMELQNESILNRSCRCNLSSTGAA